MKIQNVVDMHPLYVSHTGIPLYVSIHYNLIRCYGVTNAIILTVLERLNENDPYIFPQGNKSLFKHFEFLQMAQKTFQRKIKELCDLNVLKRDKNNCTFIINYTQMLKDFKTKNKTPQEMKELKNNLKIACGTHIKETKNPDQKTSKVKKTPTYFRFDIEKSLCEISQTLLGEDCILQRNHGQICPSQGQICPSQGQICPSHLYIINNINNNNKIFTKLQNALNAFSNILLDKYTQVKTAQELDGKKKMFYLDKKKIYLSHPSALKLFYYKSAKHKRTSDGTPNYKKLIRLSSNHQHVLMTKLFAFSIFPITDGFHLGFNKFCDVSNFDLAETLEDVMRIPDHNNSRKNSGQEEEACKFLRNGFNSFSQYKNYKRAFEWLSINAPNKTVGYSCPEITNKKECEAYILNKQRISEEARLAFRKIHLIKQ